MTSRQNIKMFDVKGVNVAKHWHVAGEVFAISDCLVNLAKQGYCIQLVCLCVCFRVSGFK